MALHEPLGALRAIAVFEAIKAAAALVAALGLLSLMHHDLHHLIESLIGHLGLDTGGHYPMLLLHEVDLVQNVDRRTLLLVAAAYCTVRLAEAHGLWHGRPWGEWLGALSGALYVPFECWHLLHSPSAFGAMVLLGNLAIVGFLSRQLWRSRKARQAAHQHANAT